MVSHGHYLQHITVLKHGFQRWIHFFHQLVRKGICSSCLARLSVGAYPGCSGLGKGEIPEQDKTNPAIIKEYGGYGVDANGDGIADPFDIENTIFSAQTTLLKSGAADGDFEKAIFNYNHSDKYVQDVFVIFSMNLKSNGLIWKQLINKKMDRQ